jgi:xylulose-5-phosphate/fructose-6-phosphate phosphoketolase
MRMPFLPCDSLYLLWELAVMNRPRSCYTFFAHEFWRLGLALELLTGIFRFKELYADFLQPGLTLVYAHLNYLTRKNDLDLIYVVGPGHGAPAILASLWLEGSLGKFYPQYSQTKQGLHNLITGFSTPHGFPSHINAETPGSIHEGGELGYALAVAFGAVMDKPDLVVACIVGDGEAESGPTATAWHAAKYIDPAESGAVIPIVHVNGFKISERTIYGCMDDKEMVSLFTGYGYQCRFVEDLDDIVSGSLDHTSNANHEQDRDLATSMQWALDEIRKIQKAARSGKPIMKPRVSFSLPPLIKRLNTLAVASVDYAHS